MTTKDEWVPLKKQPLLQNLKGKEQYLNVNLNRSVKCLNQSFVQSNSKSFIHDKSLVISKTIEGLQQHKKIDLKIVESKNEKGSLKLWNKSLSNKTFKSFSAFDKVEKDNAKKRWKNESSSKTKPSSSTLSLHIAAYENFIEGRDTVTRGKKESLKKKEKSSDSVEGKKQCLINSTLNPFEFPRQQMDEDIKPEIMQFTASQQLLNPNQFDSSEDNKEGIRNVADVPPALVHFNEIPLLFPEQNLDTDLLFNNDELLASIPDDHNGFENGIDEDIDFAQPSSSSSTSKSRSGKGSKRANNGEVLPRSASARPRSAVNPSTVLQESELRNEIQLNVCELTGEFVAPITNFQPANNPVDTVAVSNRKKNRAQQRTMDALLGQAALLAARGKEDEAIDMLHEVVRQDPRKPHAYRQIAEICENRNEMIKCFEYRLLACHVERSFNYDEWNEVGDLAVQLDRLFEASACYEKAARYGSEYWVFFEKRIKILQQLDSVPLIMKTKLCAMESIDLEKSDLAFDWLEQMMREVVNYYTETNETEKSIRALMCYFVRCAREGIINVNQMDILTANLIDQERYSDVVHLILGLCTSVKSLNSSGNPGYKVVFHGGIVNVNPFPLVNVSSFIVGPDLPTVLLARVILALIYTRNDFCVDSLINTLVDREFDEKASELYLDIGNAFDAISYEAGGFAYAEKLVQSPTLNQCPHSWYLYGYYIEKTKEPTEAIDAYKHVLQLDNAHVDARINLSCIYQHLDDMESAIAVLKETTMERCRRIPDERILIRQAEVLLTQQKYDEYIRCIRLILIPHFYTVNTSVDTIMKKRGTQTNKLVHMNLRRAIMNALSRTNFERMVNRMGAIAEKDKRPCDALTPTQMHDYAMKLIEGLAIQKNYDELLYVVCYTFLHPKIPPLNMNVFQNILFYASIKAKNYPLAFEYLRYLHTVTQAAKIDEIDRKLKLRQIYTALNFVFCHQQGIAQQRFIQRCLMKAPDQMHLHLISGNNSLMAGSYKTAIYEYVTVLKERPNDSMIYFNLALCFTHLASRRDITRRIPVATRAIAFMAKYKQLRLRQGPKQEVYYNIGRMLHQLGFSTHAHYWYCKVLEEPDVEVFEEDERTGDAVSNPSYTYNLKPLAALNLAFLMQSYNPEKARLLKRQYCVI